MAKFTFFIEGIGLIHQKVDMADPTKSKWKIIFPFDGCHQVKFSYPKNGVYKTEVFGKPKTIISISVSDQTSKHEKGDNFGKFLDLSRSDLHGKNIILKRNWDSHSALLEIPFARFSLKEETYSKFVAKGGGLSSPIDLGSIGYSAKASIAGKTLTVKATEKGTVIFNESFNSDSILKIDNNCGGQPPTNETDLKELYKHIIKDKGNESKMFKVERNPPVNLPPSKRRKAPLKVDNTNVEPGIAGVPCHVVYTEELDGIL